MLNQICIPPPHTMVEMGLSEQDSRKRTRQSVSVPFLWEDRPGAPKKDWKASSSRKVNPLTPPPPGPPPSPVKLVASVPFEWEEKPGKPLPCFSQPQPAEVDMNFPPQNLIDLSSSPVCLPDDDEGHGSSPNDYGSEDERCGNYESGREAFGYETDESFCSAPSLIANRLVSTEIVSNAAPVLRTKHNISQLQTPPSPISETDSCISSYTTGTSLAGAPFLERLFPLLSSNSAFVQKPGCLKKPSCYSPMKAPSTDFESNCGFAVKRTTLEELIMMSRKRSYRRKAVDMQGQNLSMKFAKNSAVGCCIYGVYSRIEGLQRKWKRQLQLKLM